MPKEQNKNNNVRVALKLRDVDRYSSILMSESNKKLAYVLASYTLVFGKYNL